MMSPVSPANVWRKTVVPIVILLVLVGVFGVGGYVGSDQAIGTKPEWRKMIHSPAEYNLSSETVTLQSTDGIPLKAWWLPAQQEDAATRGAGVTQAGTPESRPSVNVILAHGRDMNRSGMLPRAAFLVRHNYNVLDLDLRAHGESGGDYITPGYREAFDVMGGVAHIRSRGEHGPIVVLGYSYGAVAALHAAAQCPNINAVIADSAFITPDDVLKNVAHHKGIPLKYKVGIWMAQVPLLNRSADFFFWMRTGVKLDRNKASGIAAARRIHDQSVLYISGQQDWLAPSRNARIMYQETPSAHKDFLLVPGNHNTTYSGAPEFYETNVLAFLNQYVSRQVMAETRCRSDED
jgi:pimeloyl-ACP methyl ester carboxylesterase